MPKRTWFGRAHRETAIDYRMIARPHQRCVSVEQQRLRASVSAVRCAGDCENVATLLGLEFRRVGNQRSQRLDLTVLVVVVTRRAVRHATAALRYRAEFGAGDNFPEQESICVSRYGRGGWGVNYRGGRARAA